MARTRKIKPEFFRDQTLQLLESEYPALRAMLTYAGLWTVADKNGTFQWDPYSIGFDVLPSVEGYSAEAAMVALEECGFVYRFHDADGYTYGSVPEFQRHQSIQGSETRYDARYPTPPHMLRNNDPTATRARQRRRTVDRAFVLGLKDKLTQLGMTLVIPWNDLGMTKDIPWNTEEEQEQAKAEEEAIPVGCVQERTWNDQGNSKEIPPGQLIDDEDLPPRIPQVDPFNVTARVLGMAYETLNQPAPDRAEILRFIRPVPKVVEVTKDEDMAARLIVWAFTYKTSMTIPKVASGARAFLAEAQRVDFGDPTKNSPPRSPPSRPSVADALGD